MIKYSEKELRKLEQYLIILFSHEIISEMTYSVGISRINRIKRRDFGFKL